MSYQSTELEKLQEALSYARQNAATWQGKCERLAQSITRDGVVKQAHDYALQVENIFALGHRTRDDRLLAVEKVFRRAISVASTGEAYWND